VEDLKSPKRTADLAFARQVAMYLSRELTDLSLQQIGVAFNKKDHTTVLHACRKIEEIMKDDLKMRKIVDSLVDNLKISRE
jgi:chromosomal replication initiator protein